MFQAFAPKQVPFAESSSPLKHPRKVFIRDAKYHDEEEKERSKRFLFYH